VAAAGVTQEKKQIAQGGELLKYLKGITQKKGLPGIIGREKSTKSGSMCWTQVGGGGGGMKQQAIWVTLCHSKDVLGKMKLYQDVYLMPYVTGEGKLPLHAVGRRGGLTHTKEKDGIMSHQKAAKAGAQLRSQCSKSREIWSGGLSSTRGCES